MGSCSVSDLRAPEPHGLAVCVLVPGISLSGVAVAFYVVTITKNLSEAPRGESLVLAHRSGETVPCGREGMEAEPACFLWLIAQHSFTRLRERDQK